MEYLKKIKQGLKEAQYIVSPDEIDDIKNKLDPDDVVKIVDEEIVDEKAESKAQQRFMGMVHQCKKTGDCASAAVKKAADSMTAKDAEDFASTKHKGLPEKVDENDDDFGNISMGLGQFDEDWDMRLQDTIDTSLESVGVPSEMRDMILSRMKSAVWAGYDEYRRYRDSVVGENDEDYERASREVEYGINPEAGEEDYDEWLSTLGKMHNGDNIQEQDEEDVEDRDLKDMSSDAERLMDKLELSRFDMIFQKIDKPVEKAEVIAAFARRIGVPREKLGAVMKSLRGVAENYNPKMSKNELLETVVNATTPKPNILKTIKVKELKK